MHILTGDIGGTHTRLRLAACEDRPGALQIERQYDSPAHIGLIEIVRAFLKEANVPTVRAACLAVAGPVPAMPGRQQVQLTNLPWLLDSSQLAEACGITRFRLINDFEAVGYGIAGLADSDLDVLQVGKPDPHGIRAVLGAGTGLGQAIVLPDEAGGRVLATEGGHVDFGPTSELELELARWLIAQHGRASYEDILSGPGLGRLYEFLRSRVPGLSSPDIRQTNPAADPAAAISQGALEGLDPQATAALELFVRIYGAQAGNLALATGATGGIYLAGGIAPKIISRLHGPEFMAAFRNKGRMSAYLSDIPVRVILVPDIGLRGAQHIACQLAEGDRPGRHA